TSVALDSGKAMPDAACSAAAMRRKSSAVKWNSPSTNRSRRCSGGVMGRSCGEFEFAFGQDPVERNEAHHAAVDGEEAANECPHRLGGDVWGRLDHVVGHGEDVGDGVDEEA